jgi:hypothetical protein
MEFFVRPKRPFVGFVQLWHWVKRKWERRKTRIILQNLSDEQLKDLGCVVTIWVIDPQKCGDNILLFSAFLWRRLCLMPLSLRGFTMHYMGSKDDDKKENEGGNVTQMMQQKLLDSRSIIISGEINQTLTEKVVTNCCCCWGSAMRRSKLPEQPGRPCRSCGYHSRHH